MILTNVAARLESSHSYRQETSRNESLQIWRDEPADADAAGSDLRISPPSADRVTLSRRALDLQAGLKKTLESGDEAEQQDGEIRLDPKLMAIKRVLEALTGKRIDLADLQPLADPGQPPPEEPAATGSDPQPEKVGWGMIYDLSETFTEEEKTSVVASGTLHTADNRDISFAVDLVMARSFTARNEVHLRAGDALLTDPLVLNLDGSGADYTAEPFSFDLDTDGRQENIARLKTGSGYLALDRNNDGTVNDGHELFGPVTGSGFAELAAFDSDGNGWIDENDPVFDRLRIWMQDGSAQGTLYSLDEKKVGALLLNAVGSEFTVKGPENQTLARIRQTGLFFYEDGRAGTVQQLDLQS